MIQAGVDKNNHDLYNNFIKDFTGSSKASIEKVAGSQNKVVKDIMLKNFHDTASFEKAINQSTIDPSLKEKALNLHEKYLKVHQFKLAVGGDAYYSKRSTKQLAKIYIQLLDKKTDQNVAVVMIQQSGASPQSILKAQDFIESHQLPAAKLAKPIDKGAQAVKLQQNDIAQLYGQKKVARLGADFESMKDAGGAVNVGATIYRGNPKAKIGIMIAGNHGVLGGMLGKRPDKVTEHDLGMKTQEESIWANAVLTKAGTKSADQLAYYKENLAGKWGMKSMEGTSTETIQGVDYTTTQNAKDYNLSLNLENCQVSRVSSDKKLTKETYPVMFSFTAGPNANPDIGTSTGTMQRTLNQRAINDYDFFCSCIKESLRSSLDGMAQAGVTHPLVAPLSCGIYAGSHQARIKQEYKNILNEVLNEVVGPAGEKRGQYFEQVVMPSL